jgi:maltose alpha-D-glucosyltransferase / alpha-amylase
MTREVRASALTVSLRQWLTSRRWFGGKARAVVRIDTAGLPLPLPDAGLMLLRVEYTFGPPELYQLMFVSREGAAADRLAAEHPEAVVHRFDQGAGEPTFLLAEALADGDFSAELLDLMSGGKKFPGSVELPAVLHGIGRAGGMLAAASVPELAEIVKAGPAKLIPTPLAADQSNSCVVYGRRLFLKLFRKLVPGINPELEIGRFLAATGAFPHVPPLYGSLEYRPSHTENESLTLGVLQRFTPGKPAWQANLDSLTAYFARIALLPPEDRPRASEAFERLGDKKTREAASERGDCSGSLWGMALLRPVAAAEPLAGDDLRKTALLGRRTAELHLALASDTEQPGFVPEPFTEKHQQSLRWSMRDLASRTCELLRQRLAQVPAEVQPAARQVLSQESRLLARFDEIVAERIDAQRIRCHGDYHLGQVIDTGDDFVIIDFEGEPARPLDERRAKRSPLIDVAGMIRSLHYAASQALFQQLRSERPGRIDASALREAADAWYRWSVAAFLGAYRSTAASGNFLPRSAALCDRLLGLFVLEKAVYELAYELNNRPDWVEVPLAGLLELLGAQR